METKLIYEEGTEISLQPRTSSRAAVHQILNLAPVSSLPRRKIWSAPIVPREKLVETLNALEQDNYEVVTVLTISLSQLQIVCHQVVEG